MLYSLLKIFSNTRETYDHSNECDKRVVLQICVPLHADNPYRRKNTMYVERDIAYLTCEDADKIDCTKFHTREASLRSIRRTYGRLEILNTSAEAILE